MQQILNITEARKNFSKLIDAVYKNGQSIILLRDSAPQAVIISFKRYAKQEKEWEKEFSRLMAESRKSFKKYLKKKNIPYPKIEEEMYDIVNQATGRY